MEYLSLAIVPFMVGILTPLILSLLRKANLKKESKMNKYDFIMCYSFAWAWFAIIMAIVLAIILILLNIFGGIRLEVNVIVIPFILFLIFGAFAMVREKIVVSDEFIIVTPVIGKRRTYTFSEITKLKRVIWSNGTISYKVFKDKAIFSVANTVSGFNLFIERIMAENIKIE